jgi:hypothetical protein
MLQGAKGKPPFKKGSTSRVLVMPWSSCILRALPPSGPPDGVRLCLLERSVSGPSLPAISPPESLRSWWCRWSCFLLTIVGGATPWGLVLFRHCSASRIFIMQPDCSPPPVAIQKDDHQPRGGEKQAGLRLPPSFSFKDVHHPCWSGGRAKSGSCPSRGLVTCFFLQHLKRPDPLGLKCETITSPRRLVNTFLTSNSIEFS